MIFQCDDSWPLSQGSRARVVVNEMAPKDADVGRRWWRCSLLVLLLMRASVMLFLRQRQLASLSLSSMVWIWCSRSEDLVPRPGRGSKTSQTTMTNLERPGMKSLEPKMRYRRFWRMTAVPPWPRVQAMLQVEEWSPESSEESPESWEESWEVWPSRTEVRRSLWRSSRRLGEEEVINAPPKCHVGKLRCGDLCIFHLELSST